MMRLAVLCIVLCASSMGVARAAAPDIVQLHGAGTTNPSKYFWKTIDTLEERSRLPLMISYRAVGSSTGQKEFLGADNKYAPYNDFGAGDIPMSDDRYKELVANKRSMVHIPFAMGAIGIFHSVPAADTAGLAEGASLHLDGCLLARIFSTEIKTWDHADILKANQGFKPPKGQPIKVVHRVYGSSSTTGTTEYLDSVCKAKWSGAAAAGKKVVGSTIDWAAGTFDGQGSGGVATFIKDNAYAIGYLDAGHGHDEGFSEIALKNKDGDYITTKDAGAVGIAAAGAHAVATKVFPADPTANFAAVNCYNLPNPGAGAAAELKGAKTWPIVMVSYFYVGKDLSAMEPDTAALLKAFLEYVLSAEGQGSAEGFSFVKLPQALLDYNKKTMTSVMQFPKTMKPFTFELVDKTQVGAGAGDRVLSGKRKVYAELERGLLSGQMKVLQSDLDKAIKTIKVLQEQMASINKACLVDEPKRRELASNPCEKAPASSPEVLTADAGHTAPLLGLTLAATVLPALF